MVADTSATSNLTHTATHLNVDNIHVEALSSEPVLEIMQLSFFPPLLNTRKEAEVRDFLLNGKSFVFYLQNHLMHARRKPLLVDDSCTTQILYHN